MVSSVTENCTMRLTASVMKETTLYVAQCLEVDVASQGESVDEALANLKEALELYFEDALSPRQPAPAIIAPIEIDVR
jgi:predicted RNase H-like HicB family nuclease